MMRKITVIELLRCVMWAVVICLCIVGVAGLLTGCKSKEYVPVEHVVTEHHWHTDSIRQTDSVFRDRETIVMQLDSGAMASYGIQLKSAERAWLVRSKELEKQIEQLRHMTAKADTVHDSIPVPYPVEKQLTKWEKLKIDIGGLAIGLLIALMIVYWIRSMNRFTID